MTKLYCNLPSKRFWQKLLVLGGLLLVLVASGLAQSKKAKSAFISRRGNLILDSSSRLKASGPSTLRDHASDLRATSAQYYEFENNQWVQVVNVALSYYPTGKIKEFVMTDVSGGVVLEKETYQYNAAGEVIEYLAYERVGNALVVQDGTKILETFTSGRLTEVVEQMWNTSSAAGGWVNEEKTVYTYNAAGVKLDEIDSSWNGDNWEAEEKRVYEYATAGQPATTILLQEMVGGAWVDSERMINLTWDSRAPEGGLANYTLQEKDGSNWVNSERQTMTFGANGSYVLITESYDAGQWVQAGKLTLEYDSHQNMTLFKIESPEGQGVSINAAVKSIITYNSNGNMTEIVNQEWDEDSGTAGGFVNEDRYVFSNFQSVLSAKEDLQVDLRVYPNPTDGQLVVNLKNKAGVTVELVSLTGEVLFKKPLEAGSAQQINLSALPAGNYIMRVYSKSGVHTQKIVKL
ncbi:MAG: T9SS type A sorting domain-containing protein [Rufibacter sp.]